MALKNKSPRIFRCGEKWKTICLGLEYDAWQGDELNSSDGTDADAHNTPTEDELSPSFFIAVSCAIVVSIGNSMEV